MRRGAAASQIGPEAQAAAVLHTQFGLSFGMVSAVMLMLFGQRFPTQVIDLFKEAIHRRRAIRLLQRHWPPGPEGVGGLAVNA
jgi:hypothetical protein